MTEDDDAKVAAEQENADFAAGFDDKPASSKAAAKTPAKVEKPAEPPQDDPEPPVQISRKEWEEVRAAAQRTASYESQFSKAFGTIGNIQKQIASFQKEPAPTPTRKVDIPKTAFEAFAKDFPELAEHNRLALEAALTGLNLDPNSLDEGKVEKVMAGFIAKKEMEGLEDTYPDWRTIVGAVDVTKTQPDPNNPYRQWLGTKDAEYQQRINETESPAAVQRSIALFRRETRTATKPAAEKPAARADRFRAAVQPKGDGATIPAGRSENDDFESGFANARG